MALEQALAEFAEKEVSESFALQNSKMLKVELSGATVQAKLGSMVAHQGDVKFEHAGSGGMSRFVKKAVTGEGTDLMKVSGSGEGSIHGAPGRMIAAHGVDRYAHGVSG